MRRSRINYQEIRICSKIWSIEINDKQNPRTFRGKKMNQFFFNLSIRYYKDIYERKFLTFEINNFFN